MSGAAAASGGQASASAQSKSDGHSTLNENSIADSLGSKPAGGWSLPELARGAACSARSRRRRRCGRPACAAGRRGCRPGRARLPAAGCRPPRTHSIGTGNALAAVDADDCPMSSAKPGRSSRTNSVRWRGRRGFEVVADLEEFDAVGRAAELDDFEPAKVAAVNLMAPPPAARSSRRAWCRRQDGVSHGRPAAPRRCSRPHGVHGDQVREVLLQRALHEDLGGGGKRGAVGLEHQRQQARAEIRAASRARRAR